MAPDTQALVRELTSLQHLHPHWALLDVVHLVCDRHGLSIECGDAAVHGLELHGRLSVGRLTRDQIAALGNVLRERLQAAEHAHPHLAQPAA